MQQSAAAKFIDCHRVRPTRTRPGSRGTFIARLSPRNAGTLGAWDGTYLNVTYNQASVLACLSVDHTLDNDTVSLDQTLRQAICLEKIMQGLGIKELVYDPDEQIALEYPVRIRRSRFTGPSFLARMLKQQYQVCIIHHAMIQDMETPIARMTPRSMEVIGIQPGDKVKLIGEKGSKSIRCLSLDTDSELPLKTMYNYFTPPCPVDTYQALTLPWITLDLQTRLDLKIKPWQPIIAARDPLHVLAWELGGLAAAVALSALGGAVVLPKEVSTQYPWLPGGIIATGFFVVLLFILIKIRSRI